MSFIFKFYGIFLLSLFSSFGMYLMKLSLTKLIPPGAAFAEVWRAMPRIIGEANFWMGGMCLGVALVVFLFLLQGDELSMIFPIIAGVNIMLTMLVAVLLLGDAVSVPRYIGTVLIISGVFCIHANR